MPINGLGLVHKQRNSTATQRIFDRRTQVGCRQRAQAEHPLAVEVERRLRGDQHPNTRCTIQQGGHQVGHGLEQMLGVVQRQQHAS